MQGSRVRYAEIEIRTSLIPDGDPKEKIALMERWTEISETSGIPGGFVAGDIHVVFSLT